MAVAAAAPDDVDGFVAVSRQRAQAFHGVAVAARQALVDAEHQLSQSLRHRLARLLAGFQNLLDHGIRREEPIVVHVHNRSLNARAFRLVSGADKILEAHFLTEALHTHVLVQAALADGLLVHNVGDAVQFAANGLDHPQPHDVLQEAVPEVVAALVGEVFAVGRRRGERAAVLHAEQAPRARGEEHRGQIARGNRQKRAAGVVGGGQHHARVVADLLGDRGLHRPQARPGHGDVAEEAPRDVEAGQHRFVPSAGLGVQKAGRRGVGVLEGLLAGQQKAQVIGDHKEGLSRFQLFGVLALQGQELIDGVEGLALDARAAVELFGAHDGVGHLEHALSALVAIGHGVAHQVVVSIQQDEIDAPGVDADGFRREPRLLAQGKPAHELAVEQVDVPAIVAAPAHLAVVESVHLFQMDAAVFHKAHHHAARGGSDVHRRIAVAPQITGRMRHVAIPIFARQ